MRNTSHTADLEVGSVGAIVDEHGRVEGLGRLIPAHATMCSALASPTTSFVVVTYRAAPSTTASDGPRRWPADHVQRARSMAQVKRLVWCHRVSVVLVLPAAGRLVRTRATRAPARGAL